MIINYDDIRTWAPVLTAELSGMLPRSVTESLVTAAPKYIEDARDLVFELAGRDAVIDRVLEWICTHSIAAFHGTRLTPEEQDNVLRSGLLPLRAEARNERLVRALSKHERWSEVETRLDAELHAHGPGEAMGRRQCQVHLTLSKAGLTDGFCHYLERGSEFDQRVAYALLGADGERLLEADGEPVVLTVSVPGTEALDATHPYFTMEDVRGMGDVPNIVNELLSAWAFRLYNPSFEPRTLQTDCGLVFRSAVPSDRIIAVEPWVRYDPATGA